MAKKKFQYELTTNYNAMDMPYPVYAANISQAKKYIRKKLRKDEKIIELKRVYW